MWYCTFAYISSRGWSFSCDNVAHLNILVHDMINLLYYEYWTDKQKYLYVYQHQLSFKKCDDLPELPKFSKKEHTTFRNVKGKMKAFIANSVDVKKLCK